MIQSMKTLLLSHLFELSPEYLIKMRMEMCVTYFNAIYVKINPN